MRKYRYQVYYRTGRAFSKIVIVGEFENEVDAERLVWTNNSNPNREHQYYMRAIDENGNAVQMCFAY